MFQTFFRSPAGKKRKVAPNGPSSKKESSSSSESSSDEDEGPPAKKPGEVYKKPLGWAGVTQITLEKCLFVCFMLDAWLGLCGLCSGP